MSNQKKKHSFLTDSKDLDLKDYGNGFAAYIYCYPLIMTGVTEQISCNSVSTSTSGAAPLNQFGKQTEFPSSEFTAVVLPSTSTLYASAFLNLKKEPIILHIPDFGNRYFIMPLLDGWTNVNENSPGTRIGSLEGDYVIVGPNDSRDYSGDARTIIKMDTNSVWIVGRIFTSGTDKDLSYIEDKLYPHLTLTPWSRRNDKGYIPPSNLPFNPLIGGFISPIYEIYQMSMVSFFSNLAAMMNYNPALLPKDKKMVKVLTNIGFSFDDGGVSFDYKKLSKKDILSANEAKNKLGKPEPSEGDSPIVGDIKNNYWTFASEVTTGDFGVHYFYRALIARWAFGANLVKECIYGYALNDSTNAVLDATNDYTIHFSPLPPVSTNGFWSVTLYNADGTLVTNQAASDAGVDYNAIGIPSVQAHSAQKNGDGSMTLYLQANPPEEASKLRNWLPTPPEGGNRNFIVFLRMYIPNLLSDPVDGNYVVEGNWVPPGIVQEN